MPSFDFGDTLGTLFDLVFRAAVKDPKAIDNKQILAIEEYQLSMIAGIAKKLSEGGGASMDLEFAKAAYNAVNQLKTNDLAILPLTYFRLFEQLIGPVVYLLPQEVLFPTHPLYLHTF